MTEAGSEEREKLVMVIDDERTVLQALNLLLQMWGYRVIAAESEGEAVERLSALDERPHAILADYRLREGRTGVQAIDRIRTEVGTHVPAVIITGDTSTDGIREARARGLTILQKPVLPPHLQAVLGKALQGTGGDLPSDPAAEEPIRQGGAGVT